MTTKSKIAIGTVAIVVAAIIGVLVALPPRDPTVLEKDSGSGKRTKARASIKEGSTRGTSHRQAAVRMVPGFFMALYVVHSPAERKPHTTSIMILISRVFPRRLPKNLKAIR